MRTTKKTLERLYAKKTDKQIGEMFGVSDRSVCDWRKQYGISTKQREPLYTLDRDFFGTIDTQEKAYALGFLSADGCIHQSGQYAAIALKATDEHILHDLRSAMKSNAPIRDKIAGGFPGSKPQKQIAFHSIKLVADLARLGVTPRKSKTLRYPDIPASMESHFARGSFDGDGHIRAIPKRLFCFLGTPHFIEGLQDAIIRHTGIELGIYPCKGVWRLSGYGGSADVMRWIYRDATIFLRRKHRVFIEHWQ